MEVRGLHRHLRADGGLDGHLLDKGARLAHTAATLAAVALGIEITLITVQAARAVPSHFNAQAALDSLLFNAMGASIVSALGGDPGARAAAGPPADG